MRARAVLPTPATRIVTGADKGSAARSKIPGADLGLLGSVPKGPAYPVGKVGSAGETDSKTWPDACTMLSDADIRTLLPKSTKVKREGQHASFLGGGETAKFATCKYDVSEPGDIGGQPSWFEIDLQAVGDPAAVSHQWQEQYADQKKASAKYPDQFLDYSGGQLGGAKCFFDGNQFQCAKGHFLVWVLGQDTKESNDGANAFEAEQTGYVEQVEAEVVATLASRMS